jgi:hypothetical protein
MSLQARMVDATALYNPNRDVAHHFVYVVQAATSRLENDVWPELSDILRDANIEDVDVAEAVACYCEYVAMGKTDPLLPMHEALEASGFLRCKPQAQIAVMATIGAIYTGIQHAGVREATIGGEGPAMKLGELLREGDRAAKLLSRPRWERRLRSAYSWLCGVLFSLWRKK